MDLAIFTDCCIITAGVFWAIIPFDKKRVRAVWAKSAFGVLAAIWIPVGIVRLAWNLGCFQLGTDAFDRVNCYLYTANGMVYGIVISLILSRQFMGVKRDLDNKSSA